MKSRVRSMGTLQAKVKRLDWDIQAQVIVALRSLTNPIKQDIRSELKRPKSGPIITRSNPTRQVKVSRPYEPPAEDTGLLVNSVEVEVDPTQFNLVLSASAAYAKFLELGTRKMLPRPFLRPALVRWRKRIIDAIHSAIKKGVKNV